MKKENRIESDSIGCMEVPVSAYYGVQSLRAKQNFPVTGTPLHPVFITNLARIKKAAAAANLESGTLSADKAAVITTACDEIASGKFRGEFIVDAVQGGAGTSANMNVNE
ncbi:MAG: lyase family protein, partial [Treponema sp.]|nr:lyase family protein [Treponema sp.]